jgi:penicillin-binding protein 1C
VTFRFRYAWAAAAALFAVPLLAAYGVPLPARLTSAPSTVVYDRTGQPLAVFLSPDDKWRVAVSPADVDPAYVRALTAIEDKRFAYHPGVDPVALLRAVVQNARRGRVVSGGSTLTMQLVRMLEPRPRRLGSKLVEALRAGQLELRLGKAGVLAAYLQFAPFGRNVEGVEAASLAYFGHRADALTAAEIATLLAVPQQPNRRYPSAENAARLRSARNALARRLHAAGAAADRAAYAQAAVEPQPAPEALLPFPRRAMHAATWLRARHPNTYALRTALDPALQLLAERKAQALRGEFAAKGIHNIALVAVENTTGYVRAAVGSFDFWDAAHGGQIAAFDVPRSPGSLLKPLIYALSIDKGLALPGFLVTDTPVQYGSYAPRNFDDDFRGLVRLEDALSLSLNLPFVNLLKGVGVEPFLNLLRLCGVDTLADEPGFYGLSAAVGALEITPLQAAGIYAMLSGRGEYRPLRWLAAEPPREPLRMLSPGAAYLTREALSLRDRPDFPTRRQYANLPVDIHWKTGTSFGYRDAWAAGSTGAQTFVVWTGNADNQGTPHLVGADVAAPLLFDLLEATGYKERTGAVDRPPADLIPVEVCAYSGHVPSPACTHRKLAWAPKTHVASEPCPYHVTVDVDDATGLALTPQCREGRAYTTGTYVALPATVRRFMKERSYTALEAPPVAPFCGAQAGAQGRPAIVSPTFGHDLVLIDGMAADRQEVPLEAESPRADARLSWFIDGVFLGTVGADERLWWRPTPGRHQVLVQDQSGLSARQSFRVVGTP